MKPKIITISLGLAILAVLFVLPNNANALTAGCCQWSCPPIDPGSIIPTISCANSSQLENNCVQSQLATRCPGVSNIKIIPDKNCSKVPECPQYTGLGRTGAVIGFTNPLCRQDQPCSIPIIIGNIIRAVLGIVGSIALLMFIYGGITWLISQGNQEKVKTAKEILVWATLGLVVIFAGYILVEFIIKAVE